MHVSPSLSAGWLTTRVAEQEELRAREVEQERLQAAAEEEQAAKIWVEQEKAKRKASAKRAEQEMERVRVAEKAAAMRGDETVYCQLCVRSLYMDPAENQLLLKTRHSTMVI